MMSFVIVLLMQRFLLFFMMELGQELGKSREQFV